MPLTATEVSLTLSGRQLLRNVDVVIEAGKVTTILGPNGAGKTSLLRVLCGELNAQRGSVQIEGQNLSDISAQAKAKKLAVLPQHSALNFPFSVQEVVQLGRIPHNSGIKRDTEIVMEALQTVDCAHLASREYTRLSGGEKQRVHLARVLAQIWEAPEEGGRFLILDEPTSSLDLAHQQLTIAVVRSLAHKGVGVLLAIHDLNLAAAMSDHMVFLKQGVLVESGSPSEILRAELVRSVFDVDVTIGRHPAKGTPMVLS
jgi:heme transport system ATP-binding protein